MKIHCALSLALACACAASNRPPETLLQAREAYAHAEHSDAARFDPAGLHAAKLSLDQAEALFHDAAEPAQIETAAYVAMRRAQRAQLEGETSRMRMRTREAQAQAQAKQLEKPPAREPEQSRADDAILKLAPDIAVTDQQRSIVITLPSDDLFRARDPQLSAAANASLDKVAQALKDQGDRRILIVGYTGPAGVPDEIALSKRRAEAVAEYLRTHGVPRDKLATRGLGANNPIASDRTTTGRADNARIEILVRKR
jgi:outer membrane protein OmpA-like peptidoglycan-associated protein